MGLYDEITVSKKWIPEKEGVVFQTKDLECYLYGYHINDDGSITLKQEYKKWAEEHKDYHTHDFSNLTCSVHLYEKINSQYVAFVEKGIVQKVVKT